jgi:hypothetical protein
MRQASAIRPTMMFSMTKSGRGWDSNGLPHFLAEISVGDGEDEEHHRDSDEEKVVRVHARTITPTAGFA